MHAHDCTQMRRVQPQYDTGTLLLQDQAEARVAVVCDETRDISNSNFEIIFEIKLFKKCEEGLLCTRVPVTLHPYCCYII